MAEVIAQRQLRNDNAEIMRRVADGETFVVTRNGRPVADLVPHQAATPGPPRLSLAEVQHAFRSLQPIDRELWVADLAAADEFFGSDDPVDDRGPLGHRQ